MSSLLDLYAKVSIDTSNYDEGLEKVEKKASNFGNSFKGVGSAISNIGKAMLPATGAIVGVGVASSKMALDFKDSMANINTLLDDDSHLEGYGTAIKDMSKETGINVSTMADGMYQAISSLGDSGKETESIFQTMGIAAKAGGAEVSDSVSLISAGMKGYNQVNGQTAKKISDLAFQTAKLGVTTFPEMAKSMQPLFPLSSSLNISYEELFGTMATLTGVTGNTAEVSTQFKAVLSNLMSPTTAMSKLIKKYGYSNSQAMLESEGLAGVLKIVQDETGGQADKMAELFSSTEAVTAMTALTGAQFDNFNMKLEEMGKATGATQTAYDKLKTSGDSIRNSLNRIMVSGIELGSTILDMVAPAIEMFAGAIESVTNWFNNLDDSQKKQIVTIGAVVAAVGPVLMVIGSVVSAIGSVIGIVTTMSGVISAGGTVIGALSAAFGAANIAAIGIIGGIAAVIAIGVALYTHWDQVKAVCISAWNAIKTTVVNAGNAIKTGITTAWNGIKTITTTVFNAIKTSVTTIWNNIKTTVTNVVNNVKTAITNAWNNVKTITTSAFNSVKSTATNIWNGIKTTISNVVNNVKSSVTNGFNTVKSSVTNSFNSIKSSISNAMSSAYSTVKDKISSMKTAARNIFSGIVPKLHISLPHISVSGGSPPFGIGGAGSLPHFSVTWNRKAMNTPYLLDGAQIFGFADNSFLGGGEAGKEVIYGHESLMNDIRNATGGDNKSADKILEYLVGGGLANDLAEAMVGMKVDIDGRDFGRVVREFA